jgi:hypothetical protein
MFPSAQLKPNQAERESVKNRFQNRESPTTTP